MALEYRFEDVHGGKWIDRLNELGLEGWEIQNFDYRSDGNVAVLMKREIPEDRPRKDGAEHGQTDAERDGKTPDDRAWMAPSTRQRYVGTGPAPDEIKG